VSEHRFDERSILVTGAGSGIGRATARRLAREGGRVMGLDQDERRLVETFAGTSGQRWRAVDLRSDEALRYVEDSGPFDVLVNAAGILRRQAFLDHDMTAWQETMDVNVKAPFRLSRQFAADHVQRHAAGVIVNVCSIESFISGYRHAAYTAAKSAILMLTRAFAYDLAAYGVRVTGVAPGVIETNMNADIRSDPEAAARMIGDIPIGRFGKPEDIAAAICYLASDDASYITGSVLLVDGGWHLY
jgi:NAD(P)-dependent dehydrogenase (short-subunit alcohol dehydrogenase family)